MKTINKKQVQGIYTFDEIKELKKEAQKELLEELLKECKSDTSDIYSIWIIIEKKLKEHGVGLSEDLIQRVMKKVSDD